VLSGVKLCWAGSTCQHSQYFQHSQQEGARRVFNRKGAKLAKGMRGRGSVNRLLLLTWEDWDEERPEEKNNTDGHSIIHRQRNAVSGNGPTALATRM